jgi:asparagine synthase (glutamine-hydrolysing)
LSGGIDSSAIVAVMQAQSHQPVKTFTIGYNESDYNEAHHARKIAKHLGTEHTELFISAEQCLDVIPSLPEFYDEPFADVSQIPTVLISKLTKNHVNVCLSGDAGDELFGGYNRYFWAETIWKWIAGIPSPIRQPLSSVLNSMPVNAVNRIYSCFQPMLPNTYKVNNLGDKLHKIGQILPAASKDELYHYLVSQWRGNLPLQNVTEPSTFLSEPNKWLKLESYPERMMSVDTQTYLPQDILVKLDRASMAASLETRVPFLDLRIMEFAWQLPLNQKIRNGEGKWLVRKLLSRYMPEKLWNRPKQGFAVPIEHWLRGPLRDWAEDLLSPKKLAEDGFLDPIPIRQVWDRHLSGENMQYALWNILTYRAWSEKWR